jgi:hypothetical protein
MIILNEHGTASRRLLQLVLAAVLFSAFHLDGFQKARLSEAQIDKLVAIGTPDDVIAGEIQGRGLDFAPTENIVRDFEHRGAGPRTLAAIRELVQGTQRFKTSGDAVTKIWEGDVVAPRWTSHEKFFLTKEGTQISGYYVSEPNDPSALGNLDEVVGTVSSDGRIRILSDGGFIWKGQLLSPEDIEGKRPNGSEGNSPEFPFRLHLVRDAAAGDLPVPLPPTTSDWGAFLVRSRVQLRSGANLL